MPTDQGGLTVSSYKLTVKTNTGTFEKDLTNCNAESSSTIINARTCTIPVATLRAHPFNLADTNPVVAVVTATNDIGDSASSSEG